MGGAGNDTINLEGEASGSMVSGGLGDDLINAESSTAPISGDEGADTLEVTNGPATLDGGDGNDALTGGAGGTGSDLLVGGAGNDSLWGGEDPAPETSGFGTAPELGGDSLDGGDGADQFVFKGTVQTGAAVVDIGTTYDGSTAVLNALGSEVFADLGSVEEDISSSDFSSDFVELSGSMALTNGVFSDAAPGDVAGTITSGFLNHVDTITGFSSGEDQIVLNSGGGFGAESVFDATLQELIDNGIQSSADTNFVFESGAGFSGLRATSGTADFNLGGTITGSAGQFFYDTDDGALYYGIGDGTMALLSIFESGDDITASDIQFLPEGDINLF
jgi:hypothetical protein